MQGRSFIFGTSWFVWACTLSACGGLVNSSGLQTDYSFDAIEYTSPTFGGTSTAPLLPQISCDTTMDDCSTATMLYDANVGFACDGAVSQCVAQAVIRVSATIDLTQQMENAFPTQAIQYGVDSVDVERVTYWIATNQLNVALPSIDIYVAPTAARDETDPAATLLASIATVPAMSNACGDTVYAMGDSKAQGVAVCSAPLTAAGKTALAGFVKNWSTPFQILAHTLITVMPGDAVPQGSVSFDARPTVGLKILD